jgi:cell wall assembly regulator SMI1
MLTLAQSYSLVLQWVGSNFSESLTAFLPRLTSEEIDRISSSLTYGYPHNVNVGLPFEIPNDVKEIYKLNNGQKFYANLSILGDLVVSPENQSENLNIFDGKTLLPLQSSIVRDFRNFHPNWLTLFTREDEDYLVLDTSNGHLLDFNHSCGDSSDAFIVYASIIDLMRTHAEFYESGGDVEGVMEFSQQYQRIWLKYNSDIGEEAIQTVLRYRT